MTSSPDPQPREITADRERTAGGGAAIATVFAGLAAVVVLLVVPTLCGFGAIEFVSDIAPDTPRTNRTIGLLVATAVAQVETLLMVRLARTSVRVV